MAHKHSVYDSDTHFSINPLTRALKNESSTKNSVIQHDHNSERVTFEIPRYFEDHDMSQCNVVQVHYINIDSQTGEKNVGIYTVDDLQVFPDDEKTVVLSWLISHNATKLVGPLHFLLRFSCVAEDNTIDYAWNTAVYSGFTVASGIYNSEQIEETYADVLEQWRKDIVNGKTAYEYAQDGGYTGTEAEFAAKLAQEYTQPDLSLPENVLGGIKNRTHYKEGGLTVVVPEGKPWMPEGAESVDEFYLTYTAPLQAGEKYVVHIDGEEFTCIGQDLSAMQPGMTAIGDCSIWGIPGLTGSGEPFLIAYIPNQDGMGLMGYMPLTEISELPTVSVCHDGVTVHKLPNEYLDLAWLPTMDYPVIVPETTLMSSDHTAYLEGLGFQTHDLYNGRKLVVVCDGKQYTTSVVSIGEGINEMILAGNLGALDGYPDTGEPFSIWFLLNKAQFNWHDNAESHTVAVYDAPIPNRIPRQFLPEDMYGTEGGLVEVLPKVQMEYVEEESGGNYFMYTENVPAFTADTKYVVEWNGVQYTTTSIDCTNQMDGLGDFGGSMVALGDIYSLSDGQMGTTATGEPFAILCLYIPGESPERVIQAMTFDGSTSLTLAIYENGEVIHKIPNKYLDLDWIPQMRTIKNVIWPQTTITLPGDSNASIENKSMVHLGDDDASLELANKLASCEKIQATINGKIYDFRLGVSLPGGGIYIVVGFADVESSPYILMFSNYAGFGAEADGVYTLEIAEFIACRNPIPKELMPESVDELVINSSTEGSTKKFKLTVNDSGTITATEMTE